MTPRQAEELLQMLNSKAHSIEALFDRVQSLGGSWTLDQLRLFLSCARGTRFDAECQTYRVDECGGDEALQRAVIEVARSFGGKPVPAAQIRARLPIEIITTDEQIRALAKRTPGLQLFGPGFIVASIGDYR